MQIASRPGHKLGSIRVPNDRVGRLIGPRGAVINKLREDTGLHPPLSRQQPPVPRQCSDHVRVLWRKGSLGVISEGMPDWLITAC